MISTLPLHLLGYLATMDVREQTIDTTTDDGDMAVEITEPAGDGD